MAQRSFAVSMCRRGAERRGAPGLRLRRRCLRRRRVQRQAREGQLLGRRYSLWGSYDFTAHYGVFARWDQAKTSKDLNPGLKDEYVNVGLATHPIKGVDVALVYKHEKMDGGLINSQLAHFRVHVADPADRRAEDGQRASDPVFPLGLRGGSGHGPVDRLRSAACEYRPCDQTVLAAEPRHLI